MKVRVIGSQGRMGQIHCETYRSLGLEIVESGEDIVSIASPDQTHGEYVASALSAKKHVFVEKPLCTSRDQLERIENLCAASPYLHVDQNFPLRYVFGDSYPNGLYRVDATYFWARPEKLGKDWRVRNYSLVMGGMIHMADLMVRDFGNLILRGAASVCTNPHKISDAIFATCNSEAGPIINLMMDGTEGPESHGHEIRYWGAAEWDVIESFGSHDKTLAIKDFIKNLDKPPENDFRATKLCLEIDECIASTSPGL